MKKDSLSTNKILAAILSGGLIAGFAGFIAHLTYHPHQPEKKSFSIAEGVVENTGAQQAVSATAGDIVPLLASAKEADGSVVAKKCLACHNLDKGGPNKVGPNLYGVVGRKPGTASGFDYSEGMKSKGGVWDYAALNTFLFDPKGTVAGTKMSAFQGVKDDKDRAAVVKYLRSLADSPLPLP